MRVFCDKRNCMHNRERADLKNNGECFNKQHIYILINHVDKIKGENKTFCGTYLKRKNKRRPHEQKSQ